MIRSWSDDHLPLCFDIWLRIFVLLPHITYLFSKITKQLDPQSWSKIITHFLTTWKRMILLLFTLFSEDHSMPHTSRIPIMELSLGRKINVINCCLKISNQLKYAKIWKRDEWDRGLSETSDWRHYFLASKLNVFKCRQTPAVPARWASSNGLEKSPLSKTVILKNLRREGMKKRVK